MTRTSAPGRLAEALPGLFAELRVAGFDAGPARQAAALGLLLALAGRGDWPDDPRRLAALLGPLLCRSPDEQADFRDRFARWVDAVSASPSTGPTPDVVPDAPRPRGAKDRGLGPRIAAAAGLAALVAGLAFWGARRPSAKIGPPPSPARIEASADVRQVPSPEPATTLPAGGGVVPSAREPGTGQEAVRAPAPRRATAWIALGLALPLGAATGWGVWWSLRARRYLRKRAGQAPDLATLSVRGAEGLLFRGWSIARASRDLRRRFTGGLSALDVAATVAATARRAGLFTPVEARRTEAPEYLVLVDRAGVRDQQAALGEALVDRLASEEVHVVRYGFEGDPRLCYPAREGAMPVSLDDLAARYPDHRLVLLSDGAGLIGPLTGEPSPWASALSAWPSRAVLTPEPARHWGARERGLAALGLIVLPASDAGLAALADLMGAGPDAPASAPASGPTPPYPARLRDRPDRWLDRAGPSPEERSALLVELRRYLGDEGYYWLSALAVYPALAWPLTLHLGAHLTGEDGRSPLLEDRRLAALARLPWCRHGTMPDWLRLALIAGLSKPREAAVRGALRDLLLSSLEGPADAFRLDIARRIPGPRLTARVLGLLRRREPADGALRDHVFAAFLLGRRPASLFVRLPRELLAALRPAPEVPSSPDDLASFSAGLRRTGRALAIGASIALGLLIATPPQSPYLHSGLAELIGSLRMSVCLAVEVAALATIICGWAIRDRASALAGLANAFMAVGLAPAPSNPRAATAVLFLSWSYPAAVAALLLAWRSRGREAEGFASRLLLPLRLFNASRTVAGLAWVQWAVACIGAADCAVPIAVASGLSLIPLGRWTANRWAAFAGGLHTLVGVLVLRAMWFGGAGQRPSQITFLYVLVATAAPTLGALRPRRARALAVDLRGRATADLRNALLLGAIACLVFFSAESALWKWPGGLGGPTGLWSQGRPRAIIAASRSWSIPAMAGLGAAVAIAASFLERGRSVAIGLTMIALGGVAMLATPSPWGPANGPFEVISDSELGAVAAILAVMILPLSLRAARTSDREPADSVRWADRLASRRLAPLVWCAGALAAYGGRGASPIEGPAAIAWAGLALAMTTLALRGRRFRVAALGGLQCAAAAAFIVWPASSTDAVGILHFELRPAGVPLRVGEVATRQIVLVNRGGLLNALARGRLVPPPGDGILATGAGAGPGGGNGLSLPDEIFLRPGEERVLKAIRLTGRQAGEFHFAIRGSLRRTWLRTPSAFPADDKALLVTVLPASAGGPPELTPAEIPPPPAVDALELAPPNVPPDDHAGRPSGDGQGRARK